MSQEKQIVPSADIPAAAETNSGVHAASVPYCGPEATAAQASQATDPLVVCHLARMLAGAADANLALIREEYPDAPLDDPESLRGWFEARPDLLTQVLAADLDSPTPEAEAPDCLTLPEYAQLDPELSKNASPWLASYVAFSKRWSPRAYEGFHEAVALWLLSTVAARRVVLHLGGPRFPSLYIALAARTSLYAKSTTTDIGIAVLYAAGLDWLLAADDATPQKFIKDLTVYIPGDFDNLLPEQQARIKLRLALTAQRGWFYEEFGQKLSAMMREGGFMADFRGILRRFDDCKERYEYGTISRGSDVVERPYLALLCNLTPADLRQCAKRGHTMWADGFLARFALVCPPKDARRRERFPTGERVIPRELIDPLRQWHDRLGVPDVTIEDEYDDEGERTGKKLVEVGNLEPKPCTLGAGVYDAFYSYGDALLDLVEAGENPDFDGNLARFAEKALRAAMLLASLENGGQIEMCHWARAQEITERWRVDLYNLYEQVNEIDLSEEAQIEEKLLQIVRKLGNPSAADAARYMRSRSSTEVKDFLDRLVDAGVLNSVKTSRTTRYTIS